MEVIDFGAVRRAIRDAARRAFGATRAAHPNGDFYAFALYSDGGAATVCPASNTEQGHTRRLEDYREDKAVVASPEAYATLFRWNTPEWVHEHVGYDHFAGVCRMINIPDQYDDDDPDGFVTFKGTLFATMLLGLRDLDAEGFFGTGERRARVTLFCSVTDDGSAVWLEEESARRLNPSAVYQAFWEQRMRWGPLAETFHHHQVYPDDIFRAFLKHLENA